MWLCLLYEASSKETAMLRRWGVEMNVSFYQQNKGNLIHSDEGPKLETSALESLSCGQITYSYNQLFC